MKEFFVQIIHTEDGLIEKEVLGMLGYVSEEGELKCLNWITPRT